MCPPYPSSSSQKIHTTWIYPGLAIGEKTLTITSYEFPDDVNLSFMLVFLDTMTVKYMEISHHKSQNPKQINHCRSFSARAGKKKMQPLTIIELHIIKSWSEPYARQCGVGNPRGKESSLLSII